MKTLSLTLGAIALSIAATPALSADIDAGKAKAGSCIVCHGDANWGGIFYTLQLGGRSADKLTVKSKKYQTGKILHPIMNLSMVGLTDQDIENISAYYQSLGKPSFTLPFVEIKGDNDVAEAATPPTAVTNWSNVATYK